MKPDQVAKLVSMVRLYVLVDSIVYYNQGP